jgi:DNA (cytosine-5)-methyltransferase 1
MCLNAGAMGRQDSESETLIPINGGHFGVAHTLDQAHGQCVAFDTTQITSATNRSNPQWGDPCHTLAKGADAPAIAFDARQSNVVQYGEKTGPLDTCGFTMGVHTTIAVRRLMPVECERLMAFPDNYTAIPHRGKPAADGPRYKALGNSWAVNCARWVGARIDMVESIQRESAED